MRAEFNGLGTDTMPLTVCSQFSSLFILVPKGLFMTNIQSQRILIELQNKKLEQIIKENLI